MGINQEFLGAVLLFMVGTVFAFMWGRRRGESPEKVLQQKLLDATTKKVVKHLEKNEFITADGVAKLIRENTGIKYARTITSTHSFDLQDNLYQFKPTVYHHEEMDKMFELAEQFLAMETDKPQLLYIWGHAYEFDIRDEWKKFDEFCKMISGHDDVFYGTNREVLLP